MIQSGGFLGLLLGKLAGPLMKVAMPLAKNVLVPLGLTAAMSAIDGSIAERSRAKRSRANASERASTTLIISNDDINDIMEIIQALEDSGIYEVLRDLSLHKLKNKKEGFYQCC